MAEVRYAESMLGICFAIRIIPARGEAIHSVYTGGLQESELAAQEAYERIWTEAGGQCELAVATLNGPMSQTWLDVAKAVKAANQAVEPDGHIVLLTELTEAPQPSLRLLGKQDLSLDMIAREIEKQTDEHAIAAAAIAEVLSNHSVSILSLLKQGEIEELGLGFVESLEGVQRLVSKATSVRLIDDANRVVTGK